MIWPIQMIHLCDSLGQITLANLGLPHGVLYYLDLLFLKVGHGLCQLMIVLAVGVTINVYFLMHFISVLYFMFLKIVSKGIKENSITGLNSNAFLYLFMVSLSYAHVSFIFLQCISLRFCGIECLSHAPSRKNLK